MLVTPDDLRERFARLPTDELLRIVKSRVGDYTPDALAAATAVLATRPPEVPEKTGREEPQPETSVTWAILGALALSSAHIAKVVVRAWREVDPQSDTFARISRDLLASPWTYVVVAVAAVWLWRQWANK